MLVVPQHAISRLSSLVSYDATAVQEMVGAAGPLRNGDEVEFMLPPPVPGVASQKPKGRSMAGSGHAVGAVRVQASGNRSVFGWSIL